VARSTGAQSTSAPHGFMTASPAPNSAPATPRSMPPAGTSAGPAAPPLPLPYGPRWTTGAGDDTASPATPQHSTVSTAETRHRSDPHAHQRRPTAALSLDPWMNWLAIGCRNEESAL
jgi:hypothetical protein